MSFGVTRKGGEENERKTIGMCEYGCRERGKEKPIYVVVIQFKSIQENLERGNA